MERRSNSIVIRALFTDLVTIVYRRVMFQSYSLLELNSKGKKKKIRKEEKTPNKTQNPQRK